jgi:hypothetical protein
MQRSLALTLVAFAMLSGTALAQNATDGNSSFLDMDADLKPFNPREAISNLVEYQTENPEFAADIATWMLFGIILFLMGFCILLFSEIKAVLVCNSRDFRQKLVDDSIMSIPKDHKGDNCEDWKRSEDRDNKMLAARPYITAIACGILLLSMAALFYPICDIITVIGLPAAPCLLLLSFGSIFATICLVTFWLGVIWSCTRIWAALIFFLISFTGSILLPTGNPIFVLIWVLLSLGVGVAYFWIAPKYFDTRPSWLQDIGDFSMDPSKIGTAIGDVVDQTNEDIRRQTSKSQEYFADQAKRLSENTPLMAGKE